MHVENSLSEDMPKIFDLYRIATAYMKSKEQVHWPEFSADLIRFEIETQRQWKLVSNGEVACVWATALSDALIWGDKNEDPSLYIHRIAANPDFRGQNLVKQLVAWADEYCKRKGLKYVRMDTVGFNEGLIGHYQKLGFDFLGSAPLENTDGLPDHYKAGPVCFFQREVK
ncbi:MAG: GNAT family N-acetyltransferase [Saprospiraceae bacterium]